VPTEVGTPKKCGKEASGKYRVGTPPPDVKDKKIFKGREIETPQFFKTLSY